MPSTKVSVNWPIAGVRVQLGDLRLRGARVITDPAGVVVEHRVDEVDAHFERVDREADAHHPEEQIHEGEDGRAGQLQPDHEDLIAQRRLLLWVNDVSPIADRIDGESGGERGGERVAVPLSAQWNAA